MTKVLILLSGFLFIWIRFEGVPSFITFIYNIFLRKGHVLKAQPIGGDFITRIDFKEGPHHYCNKMGKAS